MIELFDLMFGIRELCRNASHPSVPRYAHAPDIAPSSCKKHTSVLGIQAIIYGADKVGTDEWVSFEELATRC